MRSEALPPARTPRQSHVADVASVFALLVVLLCPLWFTGCAGLSSGAKSTGTGSDSLTLSAKLQSAVVGSAYNANITVSGGSGPYTFTVATGSLPAGLTLNASTGTISGTPTSSGTFNFTIQASTAAGLDGSSGFQIPVSNAASNVTVTVKPSVTTVASSGNIQFTATVSGTSNTAVTWSASKGTISASGSYQAPAVTVNTNVVVKAVSSADAAASATADLTITPPLSTPVAISTLSLSGATENTAYSATFQATGGTAPYSWSLKSGALPSGFSLTSGGVLSGTTSQTGPFTFTVEVTDSSSTRESASEGYTLNVSSSVSGPTIPQSFFGADFNSAKNWPPTDGMNETATLGGIRLWDDGVKWGQLNTADGIYDWTPLDNWLDRAASSNVDVLYTFGDTPQFAAITTPPGVCLQAGPYSCAPPIDVNSDGTGTDAYFQAFVTALVTHAAGRIAFYELWNEPDCNCFWSGTTAQLVRMSQDAAAIIRSLDPNAKILSPSAHGPTMATWFDGYVAAGGASAFDIVNVHMRGQNGTNGNPEEFLTVWGQVQSEVQKRNLTALPIWDDEHGILPGQGVTDPDELAGYVARSALLRAGVGIQRQYIYTWDSAAPYGLQGSESGTAWDQVAGWLIGHSISPCTASGTVYTCQLDYGEVVWDTAQTCSGGSCTTSNYTYPTKYTVYKSMTSTNVYNLSGKTVPIGYKPILLESQNQ